MAAAPRAARAAEGDAGDRLPRQRVARPVCTVVAAFRQGLAETGYVEGQNVAIEYRWAEGHYDRLPALAADLVGRKVDLIVASGGTLRHWRRKARPRRSRSSSPAAATRSGRAGPQSRPAGRQSHGRQHHDAELTPKRLELLSELVPQARVIALLVNPNSPSTEGIIRDAGSGAREGGAARYPEGQHRKRDRRCLRHPRPTARRRARRRRRSVLRQPARAARGAGIAPCRSGDLSGANSPRPAA